MNIRNLMICLALSLAPIAPSHAAGYVLCGSLMNSGVTAVFPNSCPSGWYFIAFA